MAEVKPFDRFMQVHAALHPEGRAIRELLRAEVATSRILSLYPFDLTEWLDVLFETVSPGGWDTIRATLSAGKITNGWLDSVQQLHRTLTSTLYGEWEAFDVTKQGEHLREAVEATLADSYQYKELVSRNISMVLFEVLTVASRWNQLPQMHQWAETEAILLDVLDVIFNAHVEGSIILAELEAAREEATTNQ